MNILYDVLNELDYCTKDTFLFSCSLNDTNNQYEVFPFVSSHYSSQVYLVVKITNYELAHVLGSDFLISLAKHFRKQSFHRSEMDKNTTLLLECICAENEAINHSSKVQIEDDPYYFKKYVFSYSALEEKRAIEYLLDKRKSAGDRFSLVNEIQAYLLNTEAFSSYKDNHSNQPTYSYFAELATKIPIFPLQVSTATEIKSVNSFLNEELRKMSSININALNQLLDLHLDFKEETVDTILAHWNTIAKS